MINKLYLWRNRLLHLIGIRGFKQHKVLLEDYEHNPDELGKLGFAKTVICADKNWKKFRSEPEKQNKGTETMACVTFSNMNCQETLLNKMVYMVNKGEADEDTKEIVKIFRHFNLIGTKSNFSDRYIAKLSETSWSGNNFKKVAHTVRQYGLVPESDYPYVQGWSNYYQRVPQSLIEQGQKLLEFVEFNYESVSQANYNNAKLYSPVQTSVAPYGRAIDGIYPASWKRKVHAVANDYFEDGKYDGLFDTYEPFDKKVAWNYPLGHGTVFSIKLKKKLTIFNQEKINKLKEEGHEYVLLVENCGDYKRGLWELTDNGMTKIEEDEVPEKERNNAFIMQKKGDGKLQPRNAIDFNKLLI